MSLRILTGADIQDFIHGRSHSLHSAEEVVKPILDDVQKRGEAALFDWSTRFDSLEGRPFRVEAETIHEARRSAAPETIHALETAAANVRRFAEFQLPQSKTFEPAPGLVLGQITRPLESVGAYVPGGVYPLPSTLLMTVIPAQVAGVKNICVANPRPVSETLAAAGILGVESFFRVGGAQAIAAFAFGAGQIPKVDRIVGPGNQYVAAAKKLLAGVVGIDSVAGPSEVVVIAHEGEASWIAADLLAQAEHDVNASGILITTSRKLGEAVATEVERQLIDLKTKTVAAEAISRNSAVLLVTSEAEAVEVSNHLAPEHLCLHDPRLLDSVINAGSVFLGPLSTESLGDYASGPNHVLPTSGFSRVRGGLSVLDFLKIITIQSVDREALGALAPCVTTLARMEGLEAHARAVEVRL
jgi:histidinol dehydrogenase